MIYLDNCATTPLDSAVADEMHRVNLEHFGNPSSIHTLGRQAGKVLAAARAVLAASIHATPREIVFTASGTESNNLVINSVVCHHHSSGPVHIVTTPVEHASIRNRIAYEKRRYPNLEVTEVPVDRNGLLNPEQLLAAVRPDTNLVTVLHCNNETGALQNLGALIAVKLRYPAVLLHLDIVQSYLKMNFDVRTMPMDFLTACAHKIHGPKGAAFLYVRNGIEIEPLHLGGGQEKFRRAGTENVSAIAGFATAVQCMPITDQHRHHLAQLESVFLEELNAAGLEYALNGARDHAQRMPGIVNISVEGISNKEDLQIAMDLEGIQLSSTSACHSGVVADSHVLAAMGIPEGKRAGAIRIGMSRMVTPDQSRQAARALVTVSRRIQQTRQ